MMNEITQSSYEGKTITIRDLWSIFVKRAWIIFLVAALSAVIAFGFVKLTVTPQYSSTATLYILRQEDEVASSSDFSLALNVVNDCDYLLKSNSVLDEVIRELKLDTPYEVLYNNISTSNPEDTRILEVTAVADSPELAKKIVDKLCQIGSEKITEAMGFQQVNLYEYGILNNKVSNGFGLSGYVLVAMIAAVLTYTVFLFIFLLDDRIQSPEDIERHLGLSILGEIPDANAPKKGGYYHYYRYEMNENTGRKGKK